MDRVSCSRNERLKKNLRATKHDRLYEMEMVVLCNLLVVIIPVISLIFFGLPKYRFYWWHNTANGDNKRNQSLNEDVIKQSLGDIVQLDEVHIMSGNTSD